jgi:hypothetical protein
VNTATWNRGEVEHVSETVSEAATAYGLRRGAEEFPLMLVLSIIYPCNFAAWTGAVSSVQWSAT